MKFKQILSCIFSIVCTDSFQLISDFNITNPNIVFHVDKSENELIDMTTNVLKEINDLNIYNIQLAFEDQIEEGYNNVNTITHFSQSNYKDLQYGYTQYYFNSNETDIFINEYLKYYPTVYYNVLLHEFIHALGLNHTDVASIMNYSISLSDNGYILPDKKMYLSIDDINGLQFLYDKYINNHTICDKTYIISLIQECL